MRSGGVRDTVRRAPANSTSIPKLSEPTVHVAGPKRRCRGGNGTLFAPWSLGVGDCGEKARLLSYQRIYNGPLHAYLTRTTFLDDDIPSPAKFMPLANAWQTEPLKKAAKLKNSQDFRRKRIGFFFFRVENAIVQG